MCIAEPPNVGVMGERELRWLQTRLNLNRTTEGHTVEWPIRVQVTSTAQDRFIVLKGPARGPPTVVKQQCPRARRASGRRCPGTKRSLCWWYHFLEKKSEAQRRDARDQGRIASQCCSQGPPANAESSPHTIRDYLEIGDSAPGRAWVVPALLSPTAFSCPPGSPSVPGPL